MERFTGSKSALPTLDVLVSSAPVGESLENRINWLIDLTQWVRRPGDKNELNTSADAQIPTGRLRRLFDVLDHNPEWKLRVAKTLRSIINETHALDLFCATGLPRQFGLLSETVERAKKKVLPAPPGSPELGDLFARVFSHRDDSAWIEHLEEETLRRFTNLLEYQITAEERGWNTLNDDLEDALLHLTAQLQVSGGSAAVRSRVKHQNLRELPFFKLGTGLRNVFAAKENGDRETLAAELNFLQIQIDACHKMAEDVLGHLEHHGVSTEVVYQLAFIEASLRRFETLLELAFDPNRALMDVSSFVVLLIRENRAQESLMDLFRQNFRLMSRKIAERSGETGEHYIARTPKEYVEMLWRAAGGGVIMAFTTWFKTLILLLRLPGLMQGLAASVNYSIGFVAIQLTGSTLATKQPANTASNLAARMHHVRERHAMEQLVDEIVLLIRSQFASVAGNLVSIVPVTIALHFIVMAITGKPLIGKAQAEHAIKYVSILGPTAIYAAFTGVLLSASGLVAAWADNWFVCNHIGAAIETDRRLGRLLGTSRTLRFAKFWKRNIAGFAGNISFGFMLGIIPEVAKFAGLPLDIRHVTLSASLLTMAAASLGPQAMAAWPFWLAVIGVASAGVMNVVVSFGLSLFVAIRARGVQSPERRAIYAAVWTRLKQQPASFFLPVGQSAEPPVSKLAVKVP
jgi:site-specific recombinase